MATPEDTTALHDPKPRSRRALLVGAVGGLGAWIAAAAGRVGPVEAAAGDPIRMGRINRAGETSTELRANTTSDALRIVQNRRGVALRAESAGTAINAVTKHPKKHAIYARNLALTGDPDGAVVKIVGGPHTGILILGGSPYGIRVEEAQRGIYVLTEDGPGIHSSSEVGVAVRGSSWDGTGIQGSSELGAAGHFEGYVRFTNFEDAGRCELFSRLNGAGKSELCVAFPNGPTQVLATEP